MKSLTSVLKRDQPISAYEVQSPFYYGKHLTPEDAKALKAFVAEFGEQLSERLDVASAILAVGSSVFPVEFWNDTKRMNIDHPGTNAPETYRDIDLVIVPHKRTSLDALEMAVDQALSYLNMESTKHMGTAMGTFYKNGISHDREGNTEEILAPYLAVDYGMHSVTTTLASGTRLDLILGREDLIKQTADKKIGSERRDNRCFSLLHY